MKKARGKKINYNKETKYLYSEYIRIRREVMKAVESGMPFIPISDWIQTFDTPMFIEKHDKDMMQAIVKYKKELKELAAEYGYNIEDCKGYLVHSDAGAPVMFSKFTPTEEEKQLEYTQKDTLKKLDELGYGVYIEEDFIVPIPLFFNKEHFPLRLSSPDGIINTYNSWEEVIELTKVKNILNKEKSTYEDK